MTKDEHKGKSQGAAKKKAFLDGAYQISTTDDARVFYDAWADSYDDEISTNGYLTPVRSARALAQAADDLTRPMLDIGCGTGISGLAMTDAGFTTIDGSDLSAPMLEKAKTKGVYRELWQADLKQPFPFEVGTYHFLAAIGVIATGHMPPETIPRLVDLLDHGGYMVFSLNDHTLENPNFEANLHALVDNKTITILFEEYGDHLPGIGLKSKVFVLKRN